MKFKRIILLIAVSIALTYWWLSAQSTDTSTFVPMGEVFSTKGNMVDLKIAGHSVKIGERLYKFQNGQQVSKLVVTQTFHTKVTARVVETSVTITKGMRVD